MDTLRAWIQPQHLEMRMLRRYQARYASQSGPYVVLDEFVPEPLAQEAGRFLIEEASYRASFGLREVKGEVTQKDWQDADEEKRFFRFQVLDEKQWQDGLSPRARSYLSLRTAFGGRRFVQYVATLTGLTLVHETEVGTHRMQSGDYLKEHRDLGNHRRVTFLLYLTPGWSEQLGGTLNLIDSDEVETCIVPKFNRLVLFDAVANQGHYVTPIQDSAGGQSRVSLGGWLHDGRD